MSALMTTAIHRFVAAARSGHLPNVISRLDSGWAILGEQQILPGYCLLLPDPVAPHLNALSGMHRDRFLQDMAKLGDAVLKVTGAVRINYEMLGNLEPALHAHVIPRYKDENPALATKPIWFYDWSMAKPFNRDEDSDLLQQIKRELGA
jgi:diadenosine tetraphosphate (Ap4A) HIT family hydrolase